MGGLEAGKTDEGDKTLDGAAKEGGQSMVPGALPPAGDKSDAVDAAKSDEAKTDAEKSDAAPAEKSETPAEATTTSEPEATEEKPGEADAPKETPAEPAASDNGTPPTEPSP